MASDPGCLRFSLLFRIRLFLPSRFSCRPAFAAVRLFLPSRFSAASPLSCLHGFPCRPAFSSPPRFPACTRLFLHPLRLWCALRYPACPTDCCLFDRCWSDPLSGRPVVRLACCRSACPTDCWLSDRCWFDPLSGRPGIRSACCPSGPPSALSSALSSALPSGYRPATVQESPDFPRARPATCLTAALAKSGRRPPVSSRFLRRRP